jgi:hypothetical protein
LVAVLAAVAVAGTPALAAKKGHHTVSCQAIKDAIAAGKSAEEVAKDLKTSATRVKDCTAPAAPHKKSSKKAS